jgi:hypothetical protein
MLFKPGWSLILSRRGFLETFGKLSAAIIPTGRHAAPLGGAQGNQPFPEGPDVSSVDFRLTPHYRIKSPLDEVIRKVQPGLDAFLTEKYAAEIEAVLKEWSAVLRQSPANLAAIEKSLSLMLEASPLTPSAEKSLRSDTCLEVSRKVFSRQLTLGREAFVRELTSSFSSLSRLTTAEFKVFSILLSPASPLVISTRVRYDLVGSSRGSIREERVGYWDLEWEGDSSGQLRVRKWQVLEETLSRASGPMFVDITARALVGNASYREQILRGSDYWRTVLDAACGIDIYGNNGVAAGDIDNDGFDDFYVCQPAGLPNRLFRNRGDGTFEDLTEAAGVGVLDSTACALFADVDSDGRQDLLVVRAKGPLLFLNRGNGRFQLQRDAFRFAQPPQGTFTSAAFADYDCASSAPLRLI